MRIPSGILILRLNQQPGTSDPIHGLSRVTLSEGMGRRGVAYEKGKADLRQGFKAPDKDLREARVLLTCVECDDSLYLKVSKPPDTQIIEKNTQKNRCFFNYPVFFSKHPFFWRT